MRKFLVILSLVVISASSCQKEVITFGSDVSETFYVENHGAAMRVLVEGNTASGTFILFVHGGPGAGSYIYDTDYIREKIGKQYAMVWWDQRNSGGSQGGANGKDLTLARMTDDLRKVVMVIKYRYGQDCSLFIIGHSYGGLLTSSFMTQGDNQTMVKGWIYADGSHNYPLNDTLTRNMLIITGEEQISLNKHKPEWEEIVAYCRDHPGNFSYDESKQLEKYAEEAETYFDEVKKISIFTLVRENAVRYDWPLTSMFVNYRYSSDAGFNRDLAKTAITISLASVDIPLVILYGKYDFVCPVGLGYDLYDRVSSTDKQIVISEISGHNIMLQDQVLFCDEIVKFVQSHK
jgi:pimeloyl-ACP methyl ester carboxylesterase